MPHSPSQVPTSSCPSRLPQKKTLVRGLHHVLGVDLRSQPGVEMHAGKTRQTGSEPHEHFPSGCVLSRLESVLQRGE